MSVHTMVYIAILIVVLSQVYLAIAITLIIRQQKKEEREKELAQVKPGSVDGTVAYALPESLQDCRARYLALAESLATNLEADLK